MKIETLRDPIPSYDKSIRERLYSRKARLAQAVTREKEPRRDRRNSKEQPETPQFDQESLVMEGSAHESTESHSPSLDVVV